MKLLIVFLTFIVCFSPSANAFTSCRNEIKNRIRSTTFNLADKKIKDPRIIGMFEQGYDLMPEELHPLFCSVPEFYLVKNFDSSATAMMYFRSELFDKAQMTASDWLTWKEQLNYGMPNDNSFKTSPEYPRIEVSIDGSEISFLYIMLVHELAHNLPRTKEFSAKWKARHDKYSGVVTEDFCFYWCHEPDSVLLKASQSEELFHRLFSQTDWINVYSKSTEEDFADSFAFYVLIKKNGPRSDYVFTVPNGSKYSLRNLMSTLIFSDKMKLLEEAFKSLPKETIKLSWDHSQGSIQ